MGKLINNYRPRVIFLMGPTTSGKTTVALALSQQLMVDIVSVDSALVYRGMDIGTAKPSIKDLESAPHRLIDICDPSEFYSAANFCHDALNEMAKITKAGRIPLLVGGSMFYFKSLLEGLPPLPTANFEMRKCITDEAKLIGWGKLYKKLQCIDSVSANRIHPNDFNRILRALEVFFISGKTLTELTAVSHDQLIYKYKVYQFAILPCDRKILHSRIERRFYHMLSIGFENEVKQLFSRSDLHINMPSICCIGYRQMWSYLSGEIDYHNMIFRGICATRQLAKRQITWLRSWSDIYWLNNVDISHVVDRILQVIK